MRDSRPPRAPQRAGSRKEAFVGSARRGHWEPVVRAHRAYSCAKARPTPAGERRAWLRRGVRWRPAPAGERPTPAGERWVPAGERPMPVGERWAPAGERRVPAGERWVPAGGWAVQRGHGARWRAERSGARGSSRTRRSSTVQMPHCRGVLAGRTRRARRAGAPRRAGGLAGARATRVRGTAHPSSAPETSSSASHKRRRRRRAPRR